MPCVLYSCSTISPRVQLCCSGHLACLVRQRHWRAQVVAVVVVDGDVGVLLSLLFLQLSLYATDHGLREGQGQRVTGGAPVWLACGNGLTSRGFAGRGTHA